MTTLTLGLLVCLAAWLALRLLAGAGLRGPALGFVLDLGPCLIGFALLLLATGRPLLSAVGIAGAALGLATVDRVKRAVLREPVVFADRAELLEVVRHPRLYLPFAGTGRVLAGAAGVVALVALAVWIEPPVWHASIFARIGCALLAPLLAAACFVVPTFPPLLRWLNRAYVRLDLSRDPATDIARVGLLASFVIHATLARAERPQLRLAARRSVLPDLRRADGRGPIVIVQGESFMDPAHLHPSLAAFVPEFTRLRGEAAAHGRLAVPCWGANTIRSEFAMLTGVSDAGLGLDRFNPYASFIDPHLPSIARRAREAGYTTVCVHPFDMRFYERARVLPMLGFDHLVGQEAFAGARCDGTYVADVEVAAKVAEMIATHGPRTLVLAVTMENHGPWAGMTTLAPPLDLPAEIPAIPDPASFGRWLRHLRGTDAMLPILTEGLRDIAASGGGEGWLMVYGDHQPSLPDAFASLGMRETQTNYLIWSTSQPARPRAADLAAHQLGTALLEAIAASGPEQQAGARLAVAAE
jgi:hypothetical protein